MVSDVEDPQAFRTTSMDPIKGNVPNASEVARFHTKADTDGNQAAIHHTLGSGPNQASPGNHDHRGGSSMELLKNVSITGSRGGNTALTSVIAVLVELGATDKTTA